MNATNIILITVFITVCVIIAGIMIMHEKNVYCQERGYDYNLLNQDINKILSKQLVCCEYVPGKCEWVKYK